MPRLDCPSLSAETLPRNARDCPAIGQAAEAALSRQLGIQLFWSSIGALIIGIGFGAYCTGTIIIRRHTNSIGKYLGSYIRVL